MGKVITIAIFAFLAAFCASCRSLHTNYQNEENIATHAKFNAKQVTSHDLTQQLINRLAIHDSTLRNTKIKITLYDTIHQHRSIQIYPRAEIQVEKQEKEGTHVESQDTQVVQATDTTVLQSQVSSDTQKSTSNEKVKTNFDFVLFLLLAAAIFGMIQIFRQNK